MAGTPHTFSVQVLKKVRYRRHPNRAAIYPSKEFWSAGGSSRTQAYEAAQRRASASPRFDRALRMFSG